MTSKKTSSDYDEFYRWFSFKFSPDSNIADIRFKSLYPKLKKVISMDQKGIDLACGGGQYTFLLNKEGYILEGLDANKSYLDLARKYSDENRLGINFHEGNLMDLNLEKKYDYALFLGNTLPHFSLEEFEVVAKNIAKILNKKGKLIIDFNDWVYLFLTRYPQQFQECEDPKIESTHNYFDGVTGVVSRNFKTPENNFNVDFVIWAPYMLDYVMGKAGYRVLKHYLRETNRYISVYEKL